MKRFPDGFYFGASTSSHQVEGGCRNDWSEWEMRNAQRLADAAVKCTTGSWPGFELNACEPENYISGRAVDHYNRFREDFDIAKKIGLNAYRFSVEWSRIEPEKGVFDEAEISHYIGMVAALKERNIEPFVTLWHWTLPVWLAEEGGVLSPGFPALFARYAAKIAGAFSGYVKYFIVINEPEIYSLNSYLRGVWPPEKRSIIAFAKSMRVLVNTHRTVYDIIKKVNSGAMIGTACNMSYFEPGGGIFNRAAAMLSERIWNGYFTGRVTGKSDFIGLNYYFHNRIYYGFNRNDNLEVSDMGWELFPSGIEHVLLKLRSYGLPVYITENGLADHRDDRRPRFIELTLRSVMRAMENGADVRGYFHWSLLDNFEWDKGFWPKFGLVHVDRKSMSRRVRISSCDVLREIIEKGL